MEFYWDGGLDFQAAWLEATVFTQPDPTSWKFELMSITIATYEQSFFTKITTNDVRSPWE